MPVGLLEGRERPRDRVPCQPSLHVHVVGHVTVIVIVDERMTVHRIVERDRGNRQQQAEKQGLVEPSRAGLVLLLLVRR